MTLISYVIIGCVKMPRNSSALPPRIDGSGGHDLSPCWLLIILSGLFRHQNYIRRQSSEDCNENSVQRHHAPSVVLTYLFFLLLDSAKSSTGAFCFSHPTIPLSSQPQSLTHSPCISSSPCPDFFRCHSSSQSPSTHLSVAHSVSVKPLGPCGSSADSFDWSSPPPTLPPPPHSLPSPSSFSFSSIFLKIPFSSLLHHCTLSVSSFLINSCYQQMCPTGSSTMKQPQTQLSDSVNIHTHGHT